MLARNFWKVVVADHTDFLDHFLDGLTAQHIRYCILGGQGVNAYVDPVVSLDLDIVIAVEHSEQVEDWLRREFQVETFPHTLNVSAAGSDLRVQLQTDPRYASFVARATERTVLGRRLPVASLDDLIQGKLWAVQDSGRRPSKRQKDLADIARLIESYPELRNHIPADILSHLI